uniref:Reverse transcriptase domain-containing protein n=1 Tax=Peronospora matthiolae TaxID=2874970 RepID=A0AAV1T2A2_9STRA
MMLAQLATATSGTTTSADDSRVILLLDFRKAYDTVDREFLYEDLRQFGFAERYVQLITRLHTGTTAAFLVNGEQSGPISVVSGIRQGCPLAPLLFLVVVEILNVAVQQSPDLSGLPVPGQHPATHVFSAFVDDSTIFLEKASQLEPALALVSQFGTLSGLVAQPSKSQIICLNRAVHVADMRGIPVLQQADTVRYLGYQVGLRPLHNCYWALRIRKLQRRLMTASRVAM